jgi:hypothetical protein
VQVLGLVFLFVDDVGQLGDDRDELRPVFFCAVQLHQLVQNIAVVGLFAEREQVALGGVVRIFEAGGR